MMFRPAGWVLLIAGGWLIAAAAGCSEVSTGDYREITASDAEGYEPRSHGTGEEAADQAGSPRAPGGNGAAAERAAANGGAADQEDPLEADDADASLTSQENRDGNATDSDPAASDESASRDPGVAAASPIPSLLPQLPGAVPPAQPLPGGIRILVKENSFKAEGPQGALRVTFDDLDLLKVMNAEPVPVDVAEQMPQWLKDLDGKRIRIRGFMYPPPLEEGLRGFVLARDNQICCFGRDPKRYDLIDVFMRDGVTTKYIQNRSFDVVGMFRIQPEEAGGKLYQLYVLEDAVVIDR